VACHVNAIPSPSSVSTRSAEKENARGTGVFEAGGVGGGVAVGDGTGVLAGLSKGCGVTVAVDSGGKVAPSDGAVAVAGGSVAPGEGGTGGSVPAVDISRVPQPVRSSSPTDKIAAAAELIPCQRRDSRV
jgi:hypothetical protein